MLRNKERNIYKESRTTGMNKERKSATERNRQGKSRVIFGKELRKVRTAQE